MNKFEVEWTGRYPCLCMGEWIISMNGNQLKIPDEVIGENMNTARDYQSWHFEDWMEVFDNYYDGLDFEDWIGKNYGWIYKMFKDSGVLEQITMEDLENLYNLINEKDWRSNSCGGCI
ncbi:MAG: hypothetical protein WA061_01935 [Microgenomates group bacterium]